MTETYSVDLAGKIPDLTFSNFGTIQFLRAEWYAPRASFFTICWAIDGHEQPMEKRIRVDMDKFGDYMGTRTKGAALDNLGHQEADRQLPRRVDRIVPLVLAAQEAHPN